MLHVVVVSISHGNAPWFYVARIPGGDFGGWAKDDGTFTTGVSAYDEIYAGTVFLSSDQATSWSNEQGWIVDRVQVETSPRMIRRVTTGL